MVWYLIKMQKLSFHKINSKVESDDGGVVFQGPMDQYLAICVLDSFGDNTGIYHNSLADDVHWLLAPPSHHQRQWYLLCSILSLMSSV